MQDDCKLCSVCVEHLVYFNKLANCQLMQLYNNQTIEIEITIYIINVCLSLHISCRHCTNEIYICLPFTERALLLCSFIDLNRNKSNNDEYIRVLVLN